MRRAILIVALAACTGENAETQVAPRLDVSEYSRSVHPILEARCATLDCHGDPGRPLRLYAETGLRAADSLRGQPITADELAANVRAIAAVDPAGELVLQKPLGVIQHQGGVVWPATDAPQPTCVSGWLAGSSADPAVALACQIAAGEVALPPP
jgi:hypothetical protein